MFFNIMPGRKILCYSRFCHTKYRKKPKYGSRFFTDKLNTFTFNAWDNVEWDENQKQEAINKVETNSKVLLSKEEIEKYETDAYRYWDSFYNVHDNKFFKDRHWLFTEFPELNNINKENVNIFELGCGVGNTIIPILQYNKCNTLKVYGCDFSEKAITILQNSEIYEEKRCHVFPLDISKNEWMVPFQENSIDIIVMIYVLSAINPDKFDHVVSNIHKYLKPGGLVLFRDYGRYDLAQLRFKVGKSLGENFYVRGDGTRVYFFEQDEIKKMFKQFNEQENIVDKRLQVNRGKLLKMFRVWIQAKYQKPM